MWPYIVWPMRMRGGGKTVQLANVGVSVPTGSIRAGRTAVGSMPSLKPTGIDGQLYETLAEMILKTSPRVKHATPTRSA